MIVVLPVLSLALLASLLVPLVLEHTGRDRWASAPVQSQVGRLSADLLIAAATACLDLTLLAHDLIPLSVPEIAGLLWNLAVILLMAPRILQADWIERATTAPVDNVSAGRWGDLMVSV